MRGISRAAAVVLPCMRRLAVIGVILFFAAAAQVSAQLVPITRCNAAIPCNIPYGLRPADAAGWTPGNNLGQGHTGMSMSTDFSNGIVPQIDRHPVSEDPVEAAARMYVRKYPSAPGSTAKAPAVKSAAAPNAPSPAAKPATPSEEKPASPAAPAPTPAPQP